MINICASHKVKFSNEEESQDRQMGKLMQQTLYFPRLQKCQSKY